MTLLELIKNSERLVGRRVSVSGYLKAGQTVAYLVDRGLDGSEPTDQPAILLSERGLAESLATAGCPVYVGSMVMIAGDANVCGCVTSHTGFAVFPAALHSLTEVSLTIEDEQSFRVSLRSPLYALGLNSVDHLTAEQLQVLHAITRFPGNYRELRDHLSNGMQHILARDLPATELELLTARLLAVGLQNVFSDYNDNLDGQWLEPPSN